MEIWGLVSIEKLMTESQQLIGCGRRKKAKLRINRVCNLKSRGKKEREVDCLRPVRDTNKHTKMHAMGAPERKKGRNRKNKEIMAEEFPRLMGHMNVHIREAAQTPCKQDKCKHRCMESDHPKNAENQRQRGNSVSIWTGLNTALQELYPS